jgi:DNA-binding XRE family transcriptional regulator
MTVTNVLEHKRKGEAQPKACLVSEHKSLENIQSLLMDTNLLVMFRERLLDLLKERDCNLYIVDTAVKDLDTWPAPLLTIPDAWSKDWLFLVSRLSDAFRLQPLPQNARFLDRKRFSVEKIASLIKRQLDPESRKRFAKVKFLEDVRAFLVWMENWKTYALYMSELPEADSTKVVKWSLSRNRDYIRVIQESGNRFEIPWDDVMYHCEPRYEFYKGRQLENLNASADQIGQRVRQIREKKGYTVQTVADKIGMKRPNLSRLEHGHHQPSLETLERIAEALEIPVFDLVARKR